MAAGRLKGKCREMSQTRLTSIPGSRPLCATGLYAMSQLTIIAGRVGQCHRPGWAACGLLHPVVNVEADVALQPSGSHAR
ncbi:hypothetical protein RLV_3344 [Rhizobium leguminosarum bv. viciae]|nr:hypothetical protein RLV_3344 [Rhizobium leguminosarum bv. viciae]